MRNSAFRRLVPWSVALSLSLTSCGGGDGTAPEPSRATSISVTPSSLALTFFGETGSVTASVRDQNGQPFNTTVSWTSDDPAVAIVSATGVVTATGNGATTVRGTAGSISATVSVSVQQVASQVTIVSGDGQTAVVGTALVDELVAQSSDAGGSPVPLIDISFSLSTGGGSLTVMSVTTDAQGRASSAWTLDTTAGLQQVTASIVGVTGSDATFLATASPGPATELLTVSGDGQVASKGTALANPMVVRLVDVFTNGVPGKTVAFAVTGGFGSVDATTVQTGSDGSAQAVWTVGLILGDNTLTATVEGLDPVTFTATSLGIPDLAVGALTASPTSPTLAQTVNLEASVANLGDGPTGTGFNASLELDGTVVGSAAVGPLGPGGLAILSFSDVGPLTEGGHTFRLVADAGGAILESDESNNSSELQITAVQATALEAGTPAPNLAGAAGSLTFFTVQVPVAAAAPLRAPVLAPVASLDVTLSGGTGNADLYVHFGERPSLLADYDCASTGATTAESCAIASPTPGTYHIAVHGLADYSGVSLLASNTESTAGAFDIELVFINSGTATQNAAFTAAEVRWESFIQNDLPDVNFAMSPVTISSVCIESQPLVDDLVDDLRIYVDIVPIDGPFGILAEAGPCLIRLGSSLPIVGSMRFDAADLAFLEVNNEMVTVVLHEMAHVLGIGILWAELGLIQNPSLPSSPGVDTHFTGPSAIAAFDAAGGTGYTGGEKVPVENELSEGSGDVHWRESVLGEELMTPSFNSGQVNPLSAISTESLADLGYTVDSSGADPYSKAFAAPARAPLGGRVIVLENDTYKGPLIVVDSSGRVLRVIRR